MHLTPEAGKRRHVNVEEMYYVMAVKMPGSGEGQEAWARCYFAAFPRIALARASSFSASLSRFVSLSRSA